MNVGAVNNTSQLIRSASTASETTGSAKTPTAQNSTASAANFASQADLNSTKTSNASAYNNTTTETNTSPTSQSSSDNSTDGNKKATADYNTFIKLLVAQMKNQDPTKPMDSTEFVSQLASFSAVQEQTETNKKLDTVNSALNTIMVDGSISRAEGYVGKYLSYTDEKGLTTQGTAQSVTIYSNGLIARLDNGQDLVIGPGVTVMNSKPSEKVG